VRWHNRVKIQSLAPRDPAKVVCSIVNQFPSGTPQVKVLEALAVIPESPMPPAKYRSEIEAGSAYCRMK
jgi:hypothetical protein